MEDFERGDLFEQLVCAVCGKKATWSLAVGWVRLYQVGPEVVAALRPVDTMDVCSEECGQVWFGVSPVRRWDEYHWAARRGR